MGLSGDTVFLLVTGLSAALLGAGTVLFFRARQRARARASWPVLLGGNLLVLAFLLSLTVLAFESYYRLAVDTTDGDSLTKVSRRWFERHWADNSWGIRDDVEYSFARAPGTRRVTFFGDSFTAGHGVLVGERFVNRVREARPGWEVHAVAFLGRSTPEQLDDLSRILAYGYQLDTVVLVYCFNDLEPFVPGMEEVYREMTRPAPRLLAPLVEHSYFLDSAWRRWSRWRAPRSGGGEDYFARIEEAYRGGPWEAERDILRRFQVEVEKAGGRLLAVTFPLLLHLGRGEAESHPMHERLAAHWEERGVPHLDLLPVLDAHRGSGLVVNSHDDHPSAFAHELAAEALLAFLDEHAPASR
jgi:hypothetical protein